MSFFEYSRDVAFCDTDAMAVVHHSNYLKYFEEARVAWMRARGIAHTHFPHADSALAVTESHMFHRMPAYFGDRLIIRLQVRNGKLKIRFRYAMHSSRGDEIIAGGETLHVVVNKQLRATRPAPDLMNVLENEPWTETWPSNLSV